MAVRSGALPACVRCSLGRTRVRSRGQRLLLVCSARLKHSLALTGQQGCANWAQVPCARGPKPEVLISTLGLGASAHGPSLSRVSLMCTGPPHRRWLGTLCAKLVLRRPMLATKPWTERFCECLHALSNPAKGAHARKAGASQLDLQSGFGHRVRRVLCSSSVSRSKLGTL